MHGFKSSLCTAAPTLFHNSLMNQQLGAVEDKTLPAIDENQAMNHGWARVNNVAAKRRCVWSL